MEKILTVKLCHASEAQLQRLKRAIDLMDGVESVAEGEENDDSDWKRVIRNVQDFLYKHQNPNDLNCPLRDMLDELSGELHENYTVKRAWNPRDVLVRQEEIPAPVPVEQPELPEMPDIGVWVQDGESRGELAEAIRTFHTVDRVEEKED